MYVAPGGSRACPYKVTTAAVNKPVELDLLKAHLKITSCSQDALLNLYIDTAVAYAEAITGVDFITRTYTTYRDNFPCDYREGYYPNPSIVLTRTPFQSLTSFQYLDTDGVTWNTVPATSYYTTVSEVGNYSELSLSTNATWPTDKIDRMDSIKIVFQTGFGDESINVPAELRSAIIQHAAAMYANRGDCSSDACAGALPPNARNTYSTYRVARL